MIRALQVRWLRWKARMQLEHIQWVREQRAWGELAEAQAEEEYRRTYADLMALEAPRRIVPQGSMSIKRRAA
jgi:hypothetical protein